MELFGLFLLVSRDVSAAAEHSAGKREPSEDSCGKKEKEKRRDHLRRESNTPSPTKQ